MQIEEGLFNFCKSLTKPNPILSGSQWANENFYLSPESSSAPGKFKAHPYQEEILDCMIDLECKIVAVKKPVRMGYTKMINATTANIIVNIGANILSYQPNNGEARGYAEDEIEPMIRDNPKVRELVETPNIRGRVKKEKTVKKNYPGGYLEMLGAESDANLNRRTARFIIADELDKITKEAGKAGDTVTQMLRRSEDFSYRKNILGGKPIGRAYTEGSELDSDVSVVDYWYKRGDMRERWLPCLKCNHYHNFDFIDMEWEKEKDETGKTIKHLFHTAHFVCQNCGHKIIDEEKREMDKKGKWIAQKPFDGIASFSFWAILSNSPNKKWEHIAKEYVQSKNNILKKKAFYNEVLAKTFEEDVVKIDAGDFEERLEEYEAQVPEGVLFLTLGADIQKDRIEVEVVGWGEYYESWGIEYKIFFGDTEQPSIWNDLKGYLTKTFTHANGNLMRIHAGAIDAGYLQTKVTEFCKPLFGLRFFAIKGAKAIEAPLIPRTPTKTKDKKAPLFYCGVNMGKTDIATHIMSTGGAGYMHYPIGSGYDTAYFKQLGVEIKTKVGRWMNPKKQRNEAFDVRNYAYIAIFLGSIDIELIAKRGGLFFNGGTQVVKKGRRVRGKG